MIVLGIREPLYLGSMVDYTKKEKKLSFFNSKNIKETAQAKKLNRAGPIMARAEFFCFFILIQNNLETFLRIITHVKL